MPETVVITRPRAQAEPLAARLAAGGHPAVVFPLLEIAPLADDSALRAALAQLDSFALAAFVSPNAIDAAFAHVKDWPDTLPIAVLGEGSRVALARHGVGCIVHSPPDPEHSDSEGLLSVLDLAALRGQRVLLVRGESGRELLADALRAAGAEVVAVPAYRRSVPALSPALARELAPLLATPHLWVVTSSEAMRGLAALAAALDPQGHVVKMQQQQFIVPHARIAQTARELGLTQVTLCASGDEGVFAAIQSRV